MNDLKGYDYGAPAQPIVVAQWRGRCIIPNRGIDTYFAAHLSSKARLRVSKVASAMPESLCLEMVPCPDVWPSVFRSQPPTEYSIDLFFFPEERDVKALDSLLGDALRNNLALKANVGEAQLLIFTSLKLPEKLHRFQGGFYFWGLFMEQKQKAASSSHIGETPGFSLITCNDKESLKSNSNEQNHSDKRGRKIDDSWRHAKPLDDLRQKTECKYCGFVSVVGGISRLKAHLGGGNPRTPECDKVPPEVKQVMADWYTGWVKTSKAVWAKNIKGSTRSCKRGRPVDNAWEHAMKVDGIRQGAKCKYCDFVSKYGGIARVRVHLHGGDPSLRVKGCPNVPPEVKDSMSEAMSKYMKIAEDRKMETFRKKLQADKRGRKIDDSWQHAKPLDDLRQKTECKYCGFVSVVGGISRLKAHLGGGNPRTPGCDKVPPEVKQVMADWYTGWVKTSKAVWAKNIKGSTRSCKRGRPVDNAWEHAMKVDGIRQGVKCKYCDFVSKYGGIARVKVHLHGGDPSLRVKGCPNVPPEVKDSMSEAMSKYMKIAEDREMETFRKKLQANEAEVSVKRHDIEQETVYLWDQKY